MENEMQDEDYEDESGLIILIQQYAKNFGIGFNSGVMENPELKSKLMQMMADALAGKRGAITDADFDA
ncbi:MAG TPA: hypothetical protein VIE17_08975 [Methylophilaceae bacterium]|jgi:hypothetical protein